MLYPKTVVLGTIGDESQFFPALIHNPNRTLLSVSQKRSLDGRGEREGTKTEKNETIRVFISTHNFLTIFSQCESQCEKNSAHIVTHNKRLHLGSHSLHIPPNCEPQCGRNSAHILRHKSK